MVDHQEAERIVGADEDAHLAAVEAMLCAEGMAEAAELLREADAEVVETGYDNWNGGTRLYTVFLSIDPASYGRLGSKRATLEEQITARVKAVYEQGDNCWFSASIRPRIQPRPDWRNSPATMSRRARRNIIDGLKVDNIAWMAVGTAVAFIDFVTETFRERQFKEEASVAGEMAEKAKSAG